MNLTQRRHLSMPGYRVTACWWCAALIVARNIITAGGVAPATGCPTARLVQWVVFGDTF